MTDPETMIKPGMIVRFVRLPLWVEQLPEESRRVFRLCLGRSYRVEAIDREGLVVLDVSSDVDAAFGGFGHEIHVETEYLDFTVQPVAGNQVT